MVHGNSPKKSHGTPTLSIVKCPDCGAEVEMFSTDPMATCETCGRTVFNESNTCIRYCPRAEECWGTERYEEFKRCTGIETAEEATERPNTD